MAILRGGGPLALGQISPRLLDRSLELRVRDRAVGVGVELFHNRPRLGWGDPYPHGAEALDELLLRDLAVPVLVHITKHLELAVGLVSHVADDRDQRRVGGNGRRGVRVEGRHAIVVVRG